MRNILTFATLLILQTSIDFVEAGDGPEGLGGGSNTQTAEEKRHIETQIDDDNKVSEKILGVYRKSGFKNARDMAVQYYDAVYRERAIQQHAKEFGKQLKSTVTQLDEVSKAYIEARTAAEKQQEVVVSQAGDLDQFSKFVALKEKQYQSGEKLRKSFANFLSLEAEPFFPDLSNAEAETYFGKIREQALFPVLATWAVAPKQASELFDWLDLQSKKTDDFWSRIRAVKEDLAVLKKQGVDVTRPIEGGLLIHTESHTEFFEYISKGLSNDGKPQDLPHRYHRFAPIESLDPKSYERLIREVSDSDIFDASRIKSMISILERGLAEMETAKTKFFDEYESELKLILEFNKTDGSAVMKRESRRRAREIREIAVLLQEKTGISGAGFDRVNQLATEISNLEPRMLTSEDVKVQTDLSGSLNELLTSTSNRQAVQESKLAAQEDFDSLVVEFLVLKESQATQFLTKVDGKIQGLKDQKDPNLQNSINLLRGLRASLVEKFQCLKDELVKP
jgi:hypothetical protein